MVNRYYGNIRPSGRRESLTSFGNGPLSPGGPSKPGAGGRLCAVLMSIMWGLSMTQGAVCFCLTAGNLDVFALKVCCCFLFCSFFYFWATISLLHEHVSLEEHFPTSLHICFAYIFCLSFSCSDSLCDTWMIQETRFHCPLSCACEQLYLLIK